MEDGIEMSEREKRIPKPTDLQHAVSALMDRPPVPQRFTDGVSKGSLSEALVGLACMVSETARHCQTV